MSQASSRPQLGDLWLAGVWVNRVTAQQLSLLGVCFHFPGFLLSAETLGYWGNLWLLCGVWAILLHPLPFRPEQAAGKLSTAGSFALHSVIPPALILLEMPFSPQPWPVITMAPTLKLDTPENQHSTPISPLSPPFLDPAPSPIPLMLPLFAWPLSLESRDL